MPHEGEKLQAMRETGIQNSESRISEQNGKELTGTNILRILTPEFWIPFSLISSEVTT